MGLIAPSGQDNSHLKQPWHFAISLNLNLIPNSSLPTFFTISL